MADAHQNGIRKELTAFPVIRKDCSFHVAGTEDQLLQAGFKMNGSAETDDLLPYGGHDSFQAVCADMGFLIGKNFFRSTMSDQGFQNHSDVRAFNAAGQLSVGESAGATFTKLHVGIRIQDTAVLQGGYIPRPCVHRPAALNKHRVCT